MWTVTPKIFSQLSSNPTFLSNPPFVHSSASEQSTLIQMPSAHCFHWKAVLLMPTALDTTNKLLFPFAVQDKSSEIVLQNFSCVFVKLGGFYMQMLWKIEARLSLKPSLGTFVGCLCNNIILQYITVYILLCLSCRVFQRYGLWKQVIGTQVHEISYSAIADMSDVPILMFLPYWLTKCWSRRTWDTVLSGVSSTTSRVAHTQLSHCWRIM